MTQGGEWPIPARRDRPLSGAERAFVRALARWKARIDYEDWCMRRPERCPASGDVVRVRTYDLDSSKYIHNSANEERKQPKSV